MPTPKIGHTHSLIHQQQPMNCLSVFDHFVGLALKGLRWKTSGNVFLDYLEWVFHTSQDSTQSLELPPDFLIPPEFLWIMLQYLVQALCNIKDGALCDKKNRKCWKPLLTVVTESSLVNVARLLDQTLKDI